MDTPLRSVADLAQGVLALAWCWAIGTAVVSLAAYRLPQGELHSAGVLIGIGLVSLELFMTSWLGLPWNPLLMAALGMPIIAIAVYRARVQARQEQSRPSTRAREPIESTQSRLDRRLAAVPIAILVMAIVTSTISALLMPNGIGNNPDGYGFYLLKARMFHIDGGIGTYFQNHEALGYSVPDHPILMPLAIDWVYLVIGDLRQQYAALINPIFLCATVTLFLSFARRKRIDIVVATTLSLFLGICLLAYIRMVAYTDLAVGAYLCVAATFTVRWIEDRRTGHAVLGAVGFGLAAWTKNEGLAMYYVSVVSLLALALYCIITQRHVWQPVVGWLVLLILPYVLISPWMMLKWQYAVHTVQGQLGNLADLSVLVERLSERAMPLATWLAIRAGVLWHVLLILAVVVLAANVYRGGVAATETMQPQRRGPFGPLAWEVFSRIDAARMYLILLFVGTLLSFIVGMLPSPDPLIASIRTTTPRLISQVTPLFFLILATELAAIAGNATARGALAQRLSPAPG